MDELGRTAARIIFPLGLILGFSIALHGHLSPGGGFAGGAIIASAFALLFLTMSEGVKREIFLEKEFSFFETFGGLVLLTFIVMGFVMRHYFLRTQHLFDLWSGEYTPILNFAGCLMVTSALTIVIWRYVR